MKAGRRFRPVPSGESHAAFRFVWISSDFIARGILPQCSWEPGEQYAIWNLLRDADAARQVALRLDLGNHAADRACGPVRLRRLLCHRPPFLSEIFNFC